MYDFESSDTDYSYEYSDVEYNTLNPYDYDLNNFKNDIVVEATPIEKLLNFIENDDLEGVKNILPGLLELEDKVKVCNGVKNVSESGDNPSDYSGDELSNDDDDESLEQPGDIKVKEVFLKGGDTMLMVAAAAAYPDIIDYILSRGVDVNYSLPNSNKCALLALTSNVCVGWRHINNTWRLAAPKCLKMLIDAGANVKVKGFLSTQESGYTALHYAAQSNYWEMLELLIHAGADVDSLSNQRESALMIAASKGFVTCCNILLLAGANAQLVDRSGSNAAYLAGVEGHKMLSDCISVYCGSAQHNVDLYKIWSQYAKKDNGVSHSEHGAIDIIDNLSNSCIESFCLSLDAPYLVTVMQDQGLTISDLKLMSASKLKEFGVSDSDCDKIMLAMEDFDRNIGHSKCSNISFEYGKPLKLITIMEMMGNMSEHVEHIDTSIDCWHSHLIKKYNRDSVLHKVTINRLRSQSQACVVRIRSLVDRLHQLKDICDSRGVSGPSRDNLKVDPDRDGGADGRQWQWARLTRGGLVAASLLAGTITVVLVARRFIRQ